MTQKTWLAVQDKKAHNRKFPNNGKAKRSWLVGMLKCPHCSYSIQLNIQHNKERTKTWRYLIDFGFSTAQGCRKRTLKTKLDDVEKAVYIAMCDKIKSLEVARHEEDTPDAETESLKAEILKYDDDIHKLMDKLLMPTKYCSSTFRSESRSSTRQNPNWKASSR